ncbi:ABC-type spermidine/putrescine transport system, permease component [Alteracholeplasma palmae J233]|uniref:ABC-type spermidine/putrescine transport system, permease component n=1 Tax=Alteracholeplasma palmae (strain ATCC 49389 / J233) TaxID=1318466 RepID=U4KQI9_ALTPJ|nr:ABC transporter permease [Alteracholeplasma palmae]CCV64660.1 ABC-type spermidine/putrescine transport system, permease component [Alteracholeplasma palmae J233]
MNKSFKKLSTPYIVWLYLLAILPIGVMIILSFIQSEGLSFDEAKVSMNAFELLFDSTTLVAIRNSFLYAGIATLISLVLGYFVAYQLFKSKFKNKLLILTIFILPMWSNLLLRTESLGNLMEHNNMVTDLLSRININIGIGIKGTPLAVIIGLVFTYLPFVILPVYTALEKIDYSLEEASLDLGLTESKTFFKVVFPLSLKGVITGAILVFLPALSGFAVPEILGKGNVLFIGNLIEQAFKNMNYGFGSLLSVVIIFMILIALFVVNKVDKEGEMLL